MISPHTKIHDETRHPDAIFGLPKRRVIGIIILIVFISGVVAGRFSNRSVHIDAQSGSVYNKSTQQEYLNKDIDFRLFWDAWNALSTTYVDQPVSQTQMLYGAIAGMTAAIGDPHTAYFDPKATQLFNNELDGSFEGIGAEIAIKKEQLVVVAPLEGSPAQAAGLRSGDRILAIDGEDTYGMTLDYAVSKIRGPKGTKVKLTIGRPGSDTREVEITRREIKLVSVSWNMIDSVAYIKLSYFHDDTKKLLDRAILDIVKRNPTGIILDMRGNPGGYLDVAIDVAGEWVDDAVVVYEKMGDGTLEEHRSRGKARLKSYPTVALINQGSASASEIVAGALKDTGRGIIVGEKSFGKGSVQTIYPFFDGSSMKITIAKWLTPNQHTIDKEGIQPDIEVKLTDEDFDEDRDPQLDKALEILKKN